MNKLRIFLDTIRTIVVTLILFLLLGVLLYIIIQKDTIILYFTDIGGNITNTASNLNLVIIKVNDWIQQDNILNKMTIIIHPFPYSFELNSRK